MARSMLILVTLALHRRKSLSTWNQRKRRKRRSALLVVWGNAPDARSSFTPCGVRLLGCAASVEKNRDESLAARGARLDSRRIAQRGDTVARRVARVLFVSRLQRAGSDSVGGNVRCAVPPHPQLATLLWSQMSA